MIRMSSKRRRLAAHNNILIVVLLLGGLGNVFFHTVELCQETLPIPDAEANIEQQPSPDVSDFIILHPTKLSKQEFARLRFFSPGNELLPSLAVVAPSCLLSRPTFSSPFSIYQLSQSFRC
jgi:hypothetical protein